MKCKLLLCLSSIWLAAAALAAPVNVVIRVSAGAPLPAKLTPLLTEWRQTGQVSNVLFLAEGKPEKPDAKALFEALAVLEFTDEGSFDTWHKQAEPLLPAGLIVRRADVLTNGELSPRNSKHSIFVVNTYTPTVSAERYSEYAKGYLKPLYESMQATKLLVRFTSYLERGEIGKVDALSVLEYRDSAAFDAMPALKKEIREKLTATNPTYPKFDKTKDALRIDGGGTFSSYVELPRIGK